MTAPIPAHLDEPRAQPDHEAMDDLGAWAVDNRSHLERRQDEIDESREVEAGEWEARDRFIEGYDA